MTDSYTEITVVGEDRTGLVARITSLLYERGVNIEDLDQAVRDGVFRMTLHADTRTLSGSRAAFREDLADLGDDLGVDVRVRFPDDGARRLAVLVTKESHCLERLLSAVRSGDLDAEVACVVGNHDHLEPLAAAHDVPFYDVGDADGAVDDADLLRVLDDHAVDLVVLARYMRILGPDVVFRYERRIVNVHPSLLPAFPGAAAYRQALEAGARVAGVTAHYVTTDLDGGPIIAQRSFPVPAGASLADLKERGQPLEAEVLLAAVRLHLADALRVRDGRVEPRADADVSPGMLAPDGG